MKRTVLLCRHGNTFNSGDKVVMVGAREDLPLTEYGREQAGALGSVVERIIKERGSSVSTILAGPLSRTFEFASIVARVAQISAPIKIDDRLKELDYGEWGGLSDDEIVSLSGQSVLRQWQEHGIRPSDVQFMPPAEQVEAEVRSLLQELSIGDEIAVVVTSNGRLREFARVLSEGRESGAKVKTGCVCVIEWNDTAWSVLGWNLDPRDLEKVLVKKPIPNSDSNSR